ncbi:hypothetical protein MHU86_21611 [Fragilaria crotonensis]|nr:hypothetical protein MHU86_21611 [Fragilaria crotonensis]
MQVWFGATTVRRWPKKFVVSFQTHWYIGSLGMAICASIVGEGLIKRKQARYAMLRVEEAAVSYLNLLGENRVDVVSEILAECVNFPQDEWRVYYNAQNMAKIINARC